MKRVAIYVRVSTNEQNTDLQKRELKEFALARGFTVFRIYEDHGKTGTNDKREMLKALICDGRARKFDVVCVWKLDRLFRSLTHLVTLLQLWNELGIEFVSIKDSIDLTTAQGRLMLHLLGAFSEFEAALIRERVRAGVANARAKGKRLGRPTRHQPSKIKQLRAQGMSYRAIQRATGAPLGSISRVIKSERKT